MVTAKGDWVWGAKEKTALPVTASLSAEAGELTAKVSEALEMENHSTPKGWCQAPVSEPVKEAVVLAFHWALAAKVMGCAWFLTLTARLVDRAKLVALDTDTLSW
jgi:hypothetical protein